MLADENDPAMRERVMELLTVSASTSANKLKFFRLAFGAAGGFGETIDTREARTAIEGMFADSKRLEIGWLVEAEQLSKTAMKVLLNLALIAGDALVRGGRLDIGAEEEGGRVEIVLRGEGPRMILDSELRDALTGTSGDAAITPRAAAAFMAHELVGQSGGSIQVSEPGNGVLLIGAALVAG